MPSHSYVNYTIYVQHDQINKSDLISRLNEADFETPVEASTTDPRFLVAIKKNEKGETVLNVPIFLNPKTVPQMSHSNPTRVYDGKIDPHNPENTESLINRIVSDLSSFADKQVASKTDSDQNETQKRQPIPLKNTQTQPNNPSFFNGNQRTTTGSPVPEDSDYFCKFSIN